MSKNFKVILKIGGENKVFHTDKCLIEIDRETFEIKREVNAMRLRAPHCTLGCFPDGSNAILLRGFDSEWRYGMREDEL